jgi:CDGSH-type Zn-finger protein
MFNKFKEFFFGKPKTTATEAPYKVEAPTSNWPFPRADVDAKASTQVKCGCGRSQSGFCVGLHSLTPEEWAVHADNPAKPKKTRAKKAPTDKPVVAAKKPRARKPAAE